MITVCCPSCGEELNFGDTLAGLRVSCKKCRSWVQLPAAASSAAPAPSAASSGVTSAERVSHPSALVIPPVSPRGEAGFSGEPRATPPSVEQQLLGPEDSEVLAAA